MTTTPVRSAGSIPTNRLEAFSDGVFAIATTLLILEIKVPHAEDGELGQALLNLWPSYLAYAVGFLTIGVMWVNHHFVIGLMQRIDRTFVFLNLFLLGFVAFIPFPTAVIAEYLTESSQSNLGAASVLYGTTMLLLTVFFVSLYARLRVADDLLKNPAVAQPIIAKALRFSAVSVALYLTGIAVSFVAPIISLVLFALVALLFAVGRLAK